MYCPQSTLALPHVPQLEDSVDIDFFVHVFDVHVVQFCDKLTLFMNAKQCKQ